MASDELDQREMNLARQASDLRMLRADLARAETDLHYETVRRFGAKLGGAQKASSSEVKQCFYCAEEIPAAAKVCPDCKRVFIEHAYEVYEAEARAASAYRNGSR